MIEVLLILALIIITALSLVILYLYRNYVTPIRQIKQAAQKIYEGDFSRRIYIKGRNETVKVCALINKIADKYQSVQQKLDDKVKELDRCTRSLDNFAYVVSHDLKAPFNSIKSIAELFRIEYQNKLDEEGKELLHFIDIKVAEMDRLLQGVLQYSRVRESEESRGMVDLNILVSEVLKEVDPPAHIHINIKNPLPVVFIEKDLIYRVFLNLIDNAVKFNYKPEGYVEIGSSSDENWHNFYVSDNGLGIEAKYFEKIFNIFYRVQEGAAPPAPGVGLAIVKKIIEYKGGQIWVESKVKEGTIFHFTLPVIESQQKKTENKLQEAHQ